MDKNNKSNSGITPEQYKRIASAVMEIMHDQKVREIKEIKDERIGNAKLLLQNYRKFKAYTKNAIGDIGKAKDTLEEMMYEVNALDDELKLEAIIRTKERTLIMVAHIEKMITVYRALCFSCGDASAERRYNIIFDKYISDCTVRPSAESLAEKYEVDRKTVFNDLLRAYDDISPLLFGAINFRP